MRRILAVLFVTACSNPQQQEWSPIHGQPNAPEEASSVQNEVTVQTYPNAVDVLWTIDNSGGMSDEQEELIAAFPRFLEALDANDTDYHIGVVSTDLDDPDHSGRLREYQGERWIHPATPDPIAAFGDMARLGSSGSMAESGRAVDYTALELRKYAYNAGFLRDDARLELIVVSDEDDSSGVNPISLPEFTEYLQTLKSSPGMVGFSAIVSLWDCACDGVGRDYIELTYAIGGVLWNIRDQPAPFIEGLGAQVASSYRDFHLNYFPVPGTIEVSVELDGAHDVLEEGVDWVYEPLRNSVFFPDEFPMQHSSVHISYERLGS